MKKKEIELIKKLLLNFDINITIISILKYFSNYFENSIDVQFYKKERNGFKLTHSLVDKINTTLSKFPEIDSIKQIDNKIFLPLKYKNKLIAVIVVFFSKGIIKIKDINLSEILEFFSAVYYYNKIYEFAIKDPLTGIYNKRYFVYNANEILEDYKHSKEAKFAVILLDIDHFKHYNDKYGHQIGDVILVQITKTISKVIQKYNTIFARYGGEEFLILLRDIDRSKAIKIANEIRLAVQGLKIYNDEYFWKMTISLGVSLFPEHGENLNLLINRADIALYESKNNGRNRVTLFNEKT